MTNEKDVRRATCVFCKHEGIRVVEATERQTYKYGFDYYAGEYFVGTCPACGMRQCFHISDTTEG